MKRILNPGIQPLAVLLVVFVALFAFAPNALADNAVIQGSSVDSGETVENDVLLNGTDVSLNGSVDGDAVIVGRTIVINGDVEGSMFVLGEDVILNGQVKGSVYAIAVSFSQLSEALIGRSFYYIGVSLITEQESEIGRDLTAITLGARQAGAVGRDTRIISGIIEIGRLILDRVNAVTTGKPLIEPTQTGTRAFGSTIAGAERFAGSIGPIYAAQHTIVAQDEPAEAEGAVSSTLSDWIIGRLRELVTYLLLGGLLIWLFPSYLDSWARKVRRRPLASGVWGLVAFIMGFVAHTIFVLLILVVGFSFAFVTLWSLAWAWWGVGLSALALSFSLFLVAVAFISKIIVAYLFGQLLFERFTPAPNMRKPWPLLTGLIIYVLLCGIPYLGWAISLIVTFLGLGSIWLFFTERNDGRKAMSGA